MALRAVVYDSPLDFDAMPNRGYMTPHQRAASRRVDNADAGDPFFITVSSSITSGPGTAAYRKWITADDYGSSVVGASYLKGIDGTGPARAAAMVKYATTTTARRSGAGINLIYQAREALRAEAASRAKTADTTMAVFAGIVGVFAGPVGAILVDRAWSAFKSLGQKLSGASGDSDEDIAALEATFKQIMKEGYPPPIWMLGWGGFMTAATINGYATSYANQFRALTNAQRDDVQDYWTTYLFFANEATVKPFWETMPTGFSAMPMNDEMTALVGCAYATRYATPITGFIARAWSEVNPMGLNYAERYAALARWARAQGPAPVDSGFSPKGGIAPAFGGGTTTSATTPTSSGSSGGTAVVLLGGGALLLSMLSKGKGLF